MSIADVVAKYKATMDYESTQSSQFKKEMENYVTNNFTNAPNHYLIQFEDPTDVLTDVHTRVQTTKDDKVLELLTLKQPKNLSGNFFDYNSYSWIVYDFNDNVSTPKIIALKMNKVLQFKDEAGQLNVFPGAFVNVKAQSLLKDTIVSLPQGTVEVVTQKNATTDKIKLGMRIPIGYGVYEVVSIDKETKDNIITFVMSTKIEQQGDKTAITNPLQFEEMIYNE